MVVTKVVLIDRLRADSSFVMAQQSARNLSIKKILVVTLKDLKLFQFFQGRYLIFVFIYKYGMYPTFLKFKPWKLSG